MQGYAERAMDSNYEFVFNDDDWYAYDVWDEDYDRVYEYEDCEPDCS